MLLAEAHFFAQLFFKVPGVIYVTGEYLLPLLMARETAFLNRKSVAKSVGSEKP